MSQMIDPPSFEASARPHVLVEATEWVNREVLVKHLHEAGYAVVGCAGPEGRDGPCALVATGDCEAARTADVIVQSMRHADPRNGEVLASLRRHYPDTPIVVEVPGPRDERFAAQYDGCHVVPYPATLSQITRAVEHALS